MVLLPVLIHILKQYATLTPIRQRVHLIIVRDTLRINPFRLMVFELFRR